MKSGFLQQGKTKEDQKIEATEHEALHDTIPKITTPHETSGTKNFETTESRESKVSPKEVASMILDVAPIPGLMPLRIVQGIRKAYKAGRALSKAPSYLSQLNKKFPKGAQMREHYNKLPKTD